MNFKLQKLTAQEINIALASLPAWAYQGENGGSLNRTFQFPDFKSAFAFMTDMSEFSESINHHPDWTNVYSRVHVRLTTHDLGGLSAKDMLWAREADRLFNT